MQPSSAEQITYDAANPEQVRCDNCEGACCRAGLFMAARDTEAPVVMSPVRWLTRPKNSQQIVRKRVPMVQTKASGARFVRTLQTIEVPKHHGLIELVNDCRQLDAEGQCGIYENRPGQCRDGLEPASAECLGYRAVYAAQLAGELD